MPIRLIIDITLHLVDPVHGVCQILYPIGSTFWATTVEDAERLIGAGKAHHYELTRGLSEGPTCTVPKVIVESANPEPIDQ